MGEIDLGEMIEMVLSWATDYEHAEDLKIELFDREIENGKLGTIFTAEVKLCETETGDVKGFVRSGKARSVYAAISLLYGGLQQEQMRADVRQFNEQWLKDNG